MLIKHPHSLDVVLQPCPSLEILSGLPSLSRTFGAELPQLVQNLTATPSIQLQDGERRFEKPLYITGHSLGGAIASVFAQALAVKVS